MWLCGSLCKGNPRAEDKDFLEKDETVPRKKKKWGTRPVTMLAKGRCLWTVTLLLCTGDCAPEITVLGWTFHPPWGHSLDRARYAPRPQMALFILATELQSSWHWFRASQTVELEQLRKSSATTQLKNELFSIFIIITAQLAFPNAHHSSKSITH